MSGSRKPSRVRSVLTLLLLASVLPAIGCAGDQCTVTGTVTLNGAPVSGGTIYFTRSSDAQMTSATIGSDGTYSVSLAEGYIHTVTLTNPQAPLPGPIPDRYASDTGLSYTPPSYSTATFTFNVTLTP